MEKVNGVGTFLVVIDTIIIPHHIIWSSPMHIIYMNLWFYSIIIWQLVIWVSHGLTTRQGQTSTPGVQQKPCFVQCKTRFDTKNNSYGNTEEEQLAPS